MEGYLVQLIYREESLGPISSDMKDFVDTSWMALLFLKSGQGWNGKMWEATGGQEDEGTVI